MENHSYFLEAPRPLFQIAPNMTSYRGLNYELDKSSNPDRLIIDGEISHEPKTTMSSKDRRDIPFY